MQGGTLSTRNSCHETSSSHANVSRLDRASTATRAVFFHHFRKKWWWGRADKLNHCVLQGHHHKSHCSQHGTCPDSALPLSTTTVPLVIDPSCFQIGTALPCHLNEYSFIDGLRMSDGNVTVIPYADYVAANVLQSCKPRLYCVISGARLNLSESRGDWFRYWLRNPGIAFPRLIACGVLLLSLCKE